MGRFTVLTLKICSIIQKMYFRHKMCEYTLICLAELFLRITSASTSAVALSTVNHI